ncbi:MAG: pyridoxal-phosphate dependent enzyme [Devosia sp.]|nr:pyridoxal-phosphate dependent enzyme [Devosia sp.]
MPSNGAGLDQSEDEWPIPSMWQYRSRLPVRPTARPVTLGEGKTPLVRSRLLEGIELYWKDETRNPTGSHKDRALSVAATDARDRGMRCMVVVSAGSTGLSNAAYAAAAGLASIAVMSAGQPPARIYPLAALGSRLVAVEADIDSLIRRVDALNGHDGLYVASTTQASNPVQAEAARTIAYELVDTLGDAPDMLVVPVGGGGTLAAIHRGFLEMRSEGASTRLPRLVAVVPSRYANLAVAWRSGIATPEAFFALPEPAGGPTILNKIAHGHAPDGVAALAAIRDSGGEVIAFDDAEAMAAVGEIGAADGLYFEPSTAILLPALRELRRRGAIAPGERIVALGCGSGFRETNVLLEPVPLRLTRARLEELPALLAAPDPTKER